MCICMQEHVVALVRQGLKEAGVSPADISCIAYTKVGHASGAPSPN